MTVTRRKFLQSGACAGAISILQPGRSPAAPTGEALEKLAEKPVLQLGELQEPIIIDKIELLRKGREHFLRVRSRDGAWGISVDNGRIDILRPILEKLVIPYFINKDARELEELLFGVYRYQSNYKLQGLALWCCVALVEFALLDLLGRRTGRSLGQLLGGIKRSRVPFYMASERRDTTPEQEVEYLQRLIQETGARAVKYRLGGRMSRNRDALPGRTAGLIPLSRKALGDKIAILADANSSYAPPQAIQVGRRLQEIGSIHYEEPCPFDDFEATKKVADALEIPVALGEQESSHWRFEAMIRHRVADVVQPDLYYYGGFIRSLRVARMAERCELPVSPHLSGGFGFVYLLHFASCAGKLGPWQEYKKGVETYGPWFDPPLRIVDGELTIPQGPGVGVADPESLLKDAVVVS